jgi:hypothetical protein
VKTTDSPWHGAQLKGYGTKRHSGHGPTYRWVSSEGRPPYHSKMTTTRLRKTSHHHFDDGVGHMEIKNKDFNKRPGSNPIRNKGNTEIPHGRPNQEKLERDASHDRTQKEHPTEGASDPMGRQMTSEIRSQNGTLRRFLITGCGRATPA